MKAASAGALATGLGVGLSGTAAASQEDGPGQDIPLPKLSVDGNLVVDTEGNTVKLRGLNMADPGKLDLTAHVRGKTALDVVDYLTNQDEGWHPRVLRIPTEPGNIAGLTPVPLADDYATGDYPIGEFDESDLEAYCENHLDAVIDRCAERGVYAIIDYHRHWGSGDQPWDDPALDPELQLYWDFIAERYGDRDHVLFEVYNEPTNPGMWGDPQEEQWVADIWYDWLDVAQPWVDTIREHTDNIILIGSPSWTQSPEGALLEPFEGENLAYTYHIYGGHTVSMNQAWGEAAGNGEGVDGVYEEFPLFVTEFGWEQAQGGGVTDMHIAGSYDDFGAPFLEWLESHEAISYTAWCADPIWRPVMFYRPFLDEDPNHPEHQDAAGDPFNEDLPEYCEDLPCEWALATQDEGEFQGEIIRAHLEEYKDDLVPIAEGEGDGNGGEDPEPSGLDVNGDGYDAQDLTGDGLYEDITGDGNLGFNDVVTFFEEHNGDVVQNNVEYFDFSGNGSVGFNDVVALFERL
ncbi:hypothetical protein GCM10025298_08130 [Natronobiforma cellulositropha]